MPVKIYDTYISVASLIEQCIYLSLGPPAHSGIKCHEDKILNSLTTIVLDAFPPKIKFRNIVEVIFCLLICFHLDQTLQVTAFMCVVRSGDVSRFEKVKSTIITRPVNCQVWSLAPRRKFEVGLQRQLRRRKSLVSQERVNVIRIVTFVSTYRLSYAA